MKPIEKLVKDHLIKLKPCVHGGEVLDAASQSGLLREQVLDFSSSVNPLGPSKKALDAATAGFKEIPAYPDSDCNVLREAIAAHYTCINKRNVVVGNGSTELMYLFAEAFMKEGEKAVMAAPTFGEYEGAIRKTGQKAKFVKLEKTSTLRRSFHKGDERRQNCFLVQPKQPHKHSYPKRNFDGNIVEQRFGARYSCFS